MTATPLYEFHEYRFTLADVPDVTVDGTTISPDALTVEFLREDGVGRDRARVDGLQRQDDGTLGPLRWALAVNGEARPEWVAFEIAGCVPAGWEATP